MKEQPILFNGPMVRAILEGRKTVTRRICKDQGDIGFLYVKDAVPFPEFWNGEKGEPYTGWAVKYPELSIWLPRQCPYGQPGDSLWVRETWAEVATIRGPEILYRANSLLDGCEPFWRPSIHMPRWASRITLEITGVKVERLQNIDNHDSWREGIPEFGNWTSNTGEARDEFARLWDSINAKRGYPFDSNPWVWVIYFKRIESEVN